jgi:hypothetical protein
LSGYTKLFGSILASTVWELPLPTKVVWITMLAMADRHGEVQASVPGLAKFAGVTIPECEAALAAFLAPDSYSRSKDNDGRRIVESDGGWRLLNHRKYTQMLSADDKRERDAERQRNHRASRVSQPVTDGNASHYTQTQTHTETQTQKKTDPDRKRAAPRPSSLGQPNLFEIACSIFGAVWTSRYHRPWVPTPAEKNQLGRWLQQAPEWQRDQWKQICGRYIGKVDEFFIKKTGSHSLIWLITKGLNEFTGPAPPSKEAIAAADLRRHERIRASERSAGPGDLGGLVGELVAGKAMVPEVENDAGRALAIAKLAARGVT